jgi:hypothetical protein
MQSRGESRRQVAVCEGIIACGFVGFAEFVIGKRAVQWPAEKNTDSKSGRVSMFFPNFRSVFQPLRVDLSRTQAYFLRVPA